ncbi:MAG: hypothetical protein QXR30_00690 [Candidatus Woesearchaeota archaeon]
MGPFTNFILDLLLGFILPFIILYILLYSSLNGFQGYTKQQKKIIVLILILMTIFLNQGFKGKFQEAVNSLGAAIIIFMISSFAIAVFGARLNVKSRMGRSIIFSIVYLFADYFTYLFFGNYLTNYIINGISIILSSLRKINIYFVGTILLVISLTFLFIKYMYPELFKKKKN